MDQPLQAIRPLVHGVVVFSVAGRAPQGRALHNAKHVVVGVFARQLRDGLGEAKVSPRLPYEAMSGLPLNLRGEKVDVRRKPVAIRAAAETFVDFGDPEALFTRSLDEIAVRERRLDPVGKIEDRPLFAVTGAILGPLKEVPPLLFGFAFPAFLERGGAIRRSAPPQEGLGPDDVADDPIVTYHATPLR